ncbi:MAG: FG-GAP repeat protein, partial [Chloroflexi bacterium]|nr:FG-GAP repeat protein [Chloroflexota bacterium]
DCDDGDQSVNPSVSEICNDGIDNNCDYSPNTCGMEGTQSLSVADAKLIGEEEDDWAGSSVASAGDVNGDGFDDLLIGADDEASGGVDAGAAYLLLGPLSGAVDLSAAEAKLIGDTFEGLGGHAGRAVSGAGDLNGDGFADLLIGAHNMSIEDSYFIGATYVLYGPVSGDVDLANADAILLGEEEDDRSGGALSGAGDVNEDGFDDLLIGVHSHGNAGAAYLFLGPVSGEVKLSDANAKFLGVAAGDSAGASVSGAGDVDGDGAADMLIGANSEGSGGNAAGAAYLLFGPATGVVDLSTADATFVGEEADDYAGEAVSGAGDVDSDGYDDMLIGAPAEGSSAANPGGIAYLVLGGVTGTVDLSAADARFVGESAYDHAGTSVAGVGDFDGDGFRDILIGASGEDSGGAQAGAVYLILGPKSGVVVLATADAKLTGEGSNHRAGGSVCGLGDTNDDGFEDVLISAVGEDSGGNDAGAAYLFFGGGL